MRKLWVCLVVSSVAVACSGGSGVDGKLVVADLNAGDWSKYCNWFNGQISSVAGKSCGGDGQLGQPIMLNCDRNPVQGTQCRATVSQAETCANRIKDDICKGVRAAMASNDCAPVGQACGALYVSSGL